VSRWTVDLSRPTSDFDQVRVAEIPGEFPRIDERWATKNYRYGFLCMQGSADDMPGSMAGFRFNLIGRIDHRSGRVATHDVGPASATQEPIFVPRHGSLNEGDGYVLALVNRYSEMRSDLLILDARDLDSEPLATLALPIRLRNGLHGTWLSAEELARYKRPESRRAN
jgi:carotenoid cleavage dioxygenase-like enzyme